MKDEFVFPSYVTDVKEVLYEEYDFNRIRFGRNTIRIAIAGVLYYTMKGEKQSSDIILIETNELQTYRVIINRVEYSKKATSDIHLTSPDQC